MQECEPINYKIRVEPDMVNFRFFGNIELLLEIPVPTEEVVLNILDIAVWGCRIKSETGLKPCTFMVDPAKEELHIRLPEKLSGSLALQIDYQGHINDKMAGFYRSKYVHQGKEKYIAVTQFEESDARRAFPCLDHPAKKATFDIAIDMDPSLTAISNGALKEEWKLESGKKRIVFEQTPKMSTYLVFFGVGEFKTVVDTKDTRVRVITLPGMEKYTTLGLEFGRKALQLSEEYYGIPYPLPKLDLIAIPDFAFGAMENWGAITFRENLLLYYPGITSKSGKERICEVISHEIAHQWFGNLVTPSDWKYLWLNESFATYFGYGVVNHFNPDWKMWDQFLHMQTSTALKRDALHETFPIEIPGGDHVVINTSTAPIIYNKGGSILRQIEDYIGQEKFKQGLRYYLKTHEYGCGASSNLWEAFEKAADLPVKSMMKSWIEQPGFPVIEAKREKDQLILTQKRFTYLPCDSDQTWLIPVSIDIFYKMGKSRQVKTLLNDRQKAVRIGENISAYKVNAGQSGFYRVDYIDSQNLEELGQRVLNQTLPPQDRWGLQSDLYALVRKGAASLESYLEFLSWYEDEDAFLPLISIAENLFQAYLVMEGAWKEKIAVTAISRIEKVFATIGYEPRPEEEHTISLLRNRILWQAVLYGSKQAIVFSGSQFDTLQKGNPVNPDIMRSVMQAGAWIENDRAFGWFEQRFRSAESEHERQNILAAMGCFQSKNLIEKSQAYVLDEIPARNKFIPIISMASNPYAIPLLWDWFVSNLNHIEQFHPMIYEMIITAIVPIAGIQNAKKIRAFFEEYMEKSDKSADAIKLSLENMEINLMMNKRTC